MAVSELTGRVGLVGRNEELAALRGLLDAHTGLRVAFIQGDPGIGKTRLLAEATRHSAGRPVLRLVGFEPEQRVPLGAAAPLLRRLSDVGEEGRRLGTLLRVTDPEPGGLEPLRVFEATYRAVSQLPDALIVIDDLQWLDDLSRALAHYLLRGAQADGRPLALLCAARPTTESLAFAQSVQRLFADAGRLVVLTLGPLDRDEGMRLARLVQPGIPDDRAELLWTTAGGSPFWIELGARGATESDHTDAIGALFDGLSGGARSCLAALVVGGRPAYSAELGEVLGWDVARVDAGLADLVDRGIVASHAGTFHTAHDLVRDVALARARDDDRTELHRRFSQLLARRADGDLHLLMQALDHAAAAGDSCMQLALAIARSPRRRLLGHRGFARLAAVAEEASADVAQTTALQTEIAALAEELGDEAAAFDRWRTLSDVLPQAGDRAQAAVRAARLGVDLGRSDEVATLLDHARHDGGADPWLKVAVDSLEHDRLIWLEHDTAAARPHVRAAFAGARRLLDSADGAGDQRALGGPARLAYLDAIEAERVSRLIDDDIDDLVIASKEKVEATRGLGDRHLIARLEANIALRFLNRWQDSEAEATSVLQDARQQIYPGVAAWAAHEVALATYNLGRAADAAAAYEQARRLGERVDTVDFEDTRLYGLGHAIEASVSSWQPAVESLRHEAERQPDPHRRLTIWRRTATCAARYGGMPWHDAVDELVHAAEADAGAADCIRCLHEVQLVGVELCARIGETARARALLASWDDAHPSPYPRAAYLRARSAAFLAAADGTAEAVDLLRDIGVSAAAAGLQLDRFWAWVGVGDVLAAADREGAVAAWTDAVHLATGLGAASEAALAKRRLRTLGVHSVGGIPRPPTDRLSGLSPREREVATLAARGLRTAEIAESLFVSPKTVEQHLSRIFAKLGVRNRAELASRFSHGRAKT